MIKINAMGDACPIPVVKTKKAIEALEGSDVVEVLVDNEFAVANVTKLAQARGYRMEQETLGEKEFRLTVYVEKDGACACETGAKLAGAGKTGGRRNVVVAVGSGGMGSGSEELGGILLKAFLYALARQDELPSAVLFYNGGVTLTCEESPSLEDLRSMEEQGVEILSCGTCLKYYGLSEKLKVGRVTDMYSIVEKLTGADLVVKP